MRDMGDMNLIARTFPMKGRSWKLLIIGSYSIIGSFLSLLGEGTKPARYSGGGLSPQPSDVSEALQSRAARATFNHRFTAITQAKPRVNRGTNKPHSAILKLHFEVNMLAAPTRTQDSGRSQRARGSHTNPQRSTEGQHECFSGGLQ